jgi:hypothetical protein
MRYRAIATQQPGGAEHQGAGADRGDVARSGGLVAQELQRLIVLEQRVGADPAGHADHVELRTICNRHRRQQFERRVAGNRFDPFGD